MKVTIEIDTSNAAFEDNPDELNRLLGEAIKDCQTIGGNWNAPLKDINGNAAGHVLREEEHD